MAPEATIRHLVGVPVMDMYIKRYAGPIDIEIYTDARREQAYLEFFVSPALLSLLITHIERDTNITYYVINKQGDLRTNTHSDGPNAVTWGVFPGKEIIQPTIVEAVSFMAWKVSHIYCILLLYVQSSNFYV